MGFDADVDATNGNDVDDDDHDEDGSRLVMRCAIRMTQYKYIYRDLVALISLTIIKVMRECHAKYIHLNK